MNKEANITICRLKKRKREDYLFLSINKDNMYFNSQPLPRLPAPSDGGGNALVYASGPNENSASTLATTTIDDISLEGSFSFFYLYK